MRASTRAFVAHRTPTRIRVKFASARRLGTDFVALERVLLEHPDVLGVQLNALTGSLIINCRKGFELTARHRQLLGLELQTSKGVRTGVRATSSPHDGLSGALIVAHLFKLVVAISNRQIGAQLLEWVVNGLVQALTHEARMRAAGRKPLLIAPSK
jgi:hypothetical protein